MIDAVPSSVLPRNSNTDLPCPQRDDWMRARSAVYGPIAAAAYLLGPVESDGSVLALPVPQAVEDQVLQIVRDGISERLHADTVHTGVALEHLAARIIETPAPPCPG